MTERGLPEAPDPPRWPTGGARVVFLIDASSRLERNMLEEWIASARPASDAEDTHDAIEIPPSRRGDRPLDPRLEIALASADGDPILAPLRVAWLAPLRDGERAARLSDLLRFGDPRDPNFLRQAWIRRRQPDRCRIVAGEPARASELRERWLQACGEQSAVTGFAQFVSRQAHLALERAERRLRGARYKVPRLVHEELLTQPAFLAEIAELARSEKRSEEALTRQAARYLKEIAATHSTFVIDLVAHLIRLLYRQGYGERLLYDREQLSGISTLAQRHPVVFLPTHRSNLDHLVLQAALHENGLPPNHTAGGINMNFFPVGPLVRRSGVFFIRRSFKDNALYKHVLSSYVSYLIEKRFSLEWYIEGGRSRLGKLLPPRFGMLAFVVDAYHRGKSDDVFLIPVSIAYDQIQELRAYSAEQRGAAKEKESFGWFLRLIRSMRRRYGDIHIRFGEPLSLREQLGPPAPSTQGPDDRSIELQKVAFEVSVRINRATPVTPTSLVTLALLGAGDRALTVGETRRGLENLVRYTEERKLPVTAEIFHLANDDGVRSTLEALVENQVVSRFDGGPESVYMIGPDEQLAAAYYANSIVHFFVNPAIAELALIAASEADGDPAEAFWREAMALRDLLKFEFFFADKDVFRSELHDELYFQNPDWEARLAEGAPGAQELVRSFRPFSAHRVLRPFLESYRVVSDRLARQDPSEPVNTAAVVADCIGLGKQYQLQRRLHSASSISKVLFENALKLADNRGLLDGEDERLGAQRRAFAEETRTALRRVEAISALAASRRAGFIP